MGLLARRFDVLAPLAIADDRPVLFLASLDIIGAPTINLCHECIEWRPKSPGSHGMYTYLVKRCTATDFIRLKSGDINLRAWFASASTLVSSDLEKAGSVENVEAINPDLLPAEKTLPEVYNSGEPLDEIFF